MTSTGNAVGMEVRSCGPDCAQNPQTERETGGLCEPVAWMDRDADWDVISDSKKRDYAAVSPVYADGMKRYSRPLFASPQAIVVASKPEAGNSAGVTDAATADLLERLESYDYRSGYDGKDWEGVTLEASSTIRAQAAELERLGDDLDKISEQAWAADARATAAEAELERLRVSMKRVADHYAMLVRISDGRHWGPKGERPSQKTTIATIRTEVEAGERFARLEAARALKTEGTSE